MKATDPKLIGNGPVAGGRRVLAGRPAATVMIARLAPVRAVHDRRMMPRQLRALATIIVGTTTIFGMMVYQHYSREPPTDAFAAAVTMAATILAWAVTGLE